MPSTVFNINFDKAINAPVFPAERTTSDSLLAHEAILIHIDESFPILLIASAGLASIGTKLSV